ncbi:MAG: hypothetical protein ACREOF_15345 [Gemmatimonadales bacterium]
MTRSLREARLRSEYVGLYPGLNAEVWLPASEVAEHVIAVVRHEGGRLGHHGRLLAEEHFEFRGGEPAPSRRNQNERREDRQRTT